MPTPDDTTHAATPPGLTLGTRPGRNSKTSREVDLLVAKAMCTSAMPTHATSTAPWYESQVLMNEKTFNTMIPNETTPTKKTHTIRGNVRRKTREKKLWKFVE